LFLIMPHPQSACSCIVTIFLAHPTLVLLATLSNCLWI
jgi:hypothetical protein